MSYTPDRRQIEVRSDVKSSLSIDAFIPKKVKYEKINSEEPHKYPFATDISYLYTWVDDKYAPQTSRIYITKFLFDMILR